MGTKKHFISTEAFKILAELMPQCTVKELVELIEQKGQEVTEEA